MAATTIQRSQLSPELQQALSTRRIHVKIEIGSTLALTIILAIGIIMGVIVL